MHMLKTSLVIGALFATVALPTLAQDAAAPAEGEVTTEAAANVADPSGTFVDEYGTSFTFSLCGETGTDLCGVLNTLEGESATEENLAFVGQLVMQAPQTAPNEWKGSLAAGGMSAEATVTQTSPDTIDIQGCRAAILCQTLTYSRAS
ncbi:MAG: hypothetical protein ACK4G5_08395 [Devosia sp.]|jgi:hypothetical protein|uniref:hypothetical protein n=1 Tax=Devosia sp. XGJD_8 TaxID=3391187 RepID=UPI001DAA96CA|nr:hypothetical protein [Alphaproteobacteria bacterium]MBU1562381.1 hypothetical protein [Alphaproteobacteria bacterium]MBU2302647.1 hypothetical protein [Alphaproteobacteria bacterium]MBU2369216.1 hypothetical protein [Alphaproteobacteria bacterium]